MSELTDQEQSMMTHDWVAQNKIIKDQATEIEQLKAQNIAMNEVVDAAAETLELFPERGGWSQAPGIRELRQALATYKQTING